MESMHITPEIPAYAAVFLGVPVWGKRKYYAGKGGKTGKMA